MVKMVRNSYVIIFYFGRRPLLIVGKPAKTIIRVVVKTSFTVLEQLLLKMILQAQIK